MISRMKVIILSSLFALLVVLWPVFLVIFPTSRYAEDSPVMGESDPYLLVVGVIGTVFSFVVGFLYVKFIDGQARSTNHKSEQNVQSAAPN